MTTQVQLKTGTLEVPNCNNLQSLIGFGSRINPNRGFLFVSKVLGKHVPTKPSTMKNTYDVLAEKIKQKVDMSEDTIVIGFAETATALGHGVYDAIATPNSFYIHSTRYEVNKPKFFEFQEEHCHAPSHILYMPEDKKFQDLIKTAKNVILVDDEVSTGNTANNIVSELKKVLPQAENYFLCTILKWTDNSFDNFDYITMYDGEFNFQKNENFDYSQETYQSVPKQIPDLNDVLVQNYGRFGVDTSMNINFNDLIDIDSIADNEKVLVLGTSEFMYAPYLLAKELETHGKDVYYQATTRSPANVEGALESRLIIKDNYFEDIDNFLYNVTNVHYDKVIVCTETKRKDKNFKLREELEKYGMKVQEVNFANTTVRSAFSGSYLPTDVDFLVKQVKVDFEDVDKKEKLIQSGQKHYSEMISKEYEPTQGYIDIFHTAFNLNKKKVAEDILSLSYNLNKKKEIILVSLLRAGTPVGVLIKRTLKEVFNKDVQHYAISIIRDRGIDENAIKYMQDRHPNAEFIFIDGWTGKGVINRELKEFIKDYNERTNSNISDNLYVLADIAGKADFSITNDDYLIPSSALNSTVSGLMSRSILTDELVGKDDFHGSIYYDEFEKSDMSLWYIDELMKIVNTLDINKKELINTNPKLQENIDLFMSEMQEKFDITDINHIKPGIGETTRVLLRRVPDILIVKDKNEPQIQHLIVLANDREIDLVEDKNLPYTALGVIKKV